MKSHYSNIRLTIETDTLRFVDAVFNANPDGS